MVFNKNILSDRILFMTGFLTISAISMSGCATGHKSPKIAEMEEAEGSGILCEVNEASIEPLDGSLWQEKGPLSDLFSDLKAKRVGDVLTINVVESSSASNEADTNTARNSSLSLQLTNMLGLENNDRFPAGSGFDPFGSIAGSTKNTFKGSGSTNRSGKLIATITARVTEVLPNGNLRIIGKREITVNREKQYIALTGIVRPRDISTDNVVLSSYIADARIAYTGAGVVNDRQRPGWLARLLDSAWPF